MLPGEDLTSESLLKFKTFAVRKIQWEGEGSSVVACSPSMHETLGSISALQKGKKTVLKIKI
jgi:hypothetical protein